MIWAKAGEKWLMREQKDGELLKGLWSFPLRMHQLNDAEELRS